MQAVRMGAWPKRTTRTGVVKEGLLVLRARGQIILGDVRWKSLQIKRKTSLFGETGLNAALNGIVPRGRRGECAPLWLKCGYQKALQQIDRENVVRTGTLVTYRVSVKNTPAIVFRLCQAT